MSSPTPRTGFVLDGVREVQGRVVCRGVGGPGSARELLAASRLRCQKGGVLQDGVACLDCDRFINYKPARNRRSVTIRCQWSSDDPVVDLMTRARALVFVDPETGVYDAADIAQRLGLHHLLVARRGDLLGVVCGCDLVPPIGDFETVADRMSESVWALPATATLADAAGVMTARGVGCLPVVDDGALLGVITRSDLRSAGFEDEALSADCDPPDDRPHLA